MAKVATWKAIRGPAVALLGDNVLTVFVQIASVPIFLSVWGPSLYGEWLLISTVTGYIALSDVGVISVAQNEIDGQCARGNFTKANRTYWNSLLILSGFLTIFCTATLLLFWALPPLVFGQFRLLGTAEVRDLAAVLATDAALFLVFNLHAGLLRSASMYTASVYWSSIGRTCGICATLLAVLAGSSPTEAGLASLYAHLLIYLLFGWFLVPQLTWLKRPSGVSLEETWRLSRLSFTYFLFPAANAVYLQGSLVVVGVGLGPSDVAMFNSLRTFTRFVPTFVGIVGRSFWSAISRYAAVGAVVELQKIARSVLWMTIVLTAAIALPYYLFGSEVFTLWTKGKFPFDDNLFWLMLVNSIIIAGYTSLEVFILSTNDHKSYSWVFLSSTIAGLAAGFFLIPYFGLSSMPITSSAASVCALVYCLLWINRRIFRRTNG